MKKNKLSLKMPAGFDKQIHFAVIILNILGLFMVISGNMTPSATPKSLVIAAAKETVFVVISYVMMVMVARNFSFKQFRKKKTLRLLILGLYIFLIGARFFPDVNGAYGWWNFKVLTIQPSEFAKVGIIVYLAVVLGDRKESPNDTWWSVMGKHMLVVLGMVFIVVVIQRDLGSGVVMAGIAYMLFMIPYHPKVEKFQKGMFIFLLIGVLFIVLSSTEPVLKLLESLFDSAGDRAYMLRRFETAADPFENRYAGSYQVFMGLVAMVQGMQAGLFGRGYARSINKWGYIPEARTDFILPITIEELGLLGIGVLLIGYSILIFKYIRYARIVRFEREKMILMGVCSYIFIHFVFNVGGVTGLIPLTGVPLLFISAGGSGRMALMIAIGLTQSVVSAHRREVRIQKKKIEARRVAQQKPEIVAAQMKEVKTV